MQSTIKTEATVEEEATFDKQQQQQPPVQAKANVLDELTVDVSIEPNHECEIVEVKYDGLEIYKEPLTHSEYLAQLISKIDFYSDSNEFVNDTVGDSAKAANKDEVTNARKFFQSLHETVKLSYDEICVLLDCLAIAKADKLMTLEMERKQLSSISDEKLLDVSDKTLSLILKKKTIEKSKVLLKNFLEKVGKQESESNSNKFHMELYRARQVWRIRKLGIKFNCDLSYRSAGCVNSMKANFELIKTDFPVMKTENNESKAQFLSVIVPDEFKENFFIKVEIINSMKKASSGSSSVFDKNFSLFTNASQGQANQNEKLTWQETLEQAQNTIFCKEIYNQLLREVFDKNLSQELRPVINGNSIRMMITPEFDLLISLVNADKGTSVLTESAAANYNYDNAVLEYFLHDLLKRYFEQNFFHYDQRPITSSFAYNSHVKIAGMAYVNLNGTEEDNTIINLPKSINHLLNRKKKINLLQSIKDKAEHLLLRTKVFRILYRICREIPEPHFFIEPCLWNSATSTDIRVTITSHYYDTLSKSSFYILIKNNQVNVLNRSSNMNLPFTDCLYNLRYYFIDQCCFHQANLIVSLTQQLGWSLLASTFINDTGTLVMSGTILFFNETFKKKIAVRIASVNQIEMYVFQYETSPSDESGINWVYIKENYTPVDIESYPGFTQIQKYELFLARFSTSLRLSI